MALPRINDDKPIYEVTLPTNKKTYRYRPFLVKEQRNILMASESESAREGVIAMLKCVESCAPDVKIEDMSTAEVDYIFLDELRANGFYNKTDQALSVLIPQKSVGVMGDKRQYGFVVAIRAVNTTDFMTATSTAIPHKILNNISSRIINEVNGVARVVYDITSKPPGTIEWE